MMRPKAASRGATVAAMIVVLALINLAVIGAIRSTGDEAQIGALRVETVRAFYAAESGATIAVRSLIAGWTPPTDGTVVSLGNAEAEFVFVPAGGVGVLVVEGRSGFGRRRISLELQ